MDELSCLHAYVVFDSVKSKIECLEFYQKFPRVLRCCRKPPEKFRYDGVHCIAVAEPTEPSDIKWENVDVSFWERLWRGLVVCPHHRPHDLCLLRPVRHQKLPGHNAQFRGVQRRRHRLVFCDEPHRRQATSS